MGAKIFDLQHVLFDLPNINLALLGREHVHDKDDDLCVSFYANRGSSIVLGQIKVALC